MFTLLLVFCRCASHQLPLQLSSGVSGSQREAALHCCLSRDTSAGGAASGSPPTQRAACPCSPNLLCHLLLAPVLDHAGSAVHTASVSQGPFNAISRVHSGEIPTCHGKTRKLKVIIFHQYSWGIWPLILNRTELNRMHT